MRPRVLESALTCPRVLGMPLPPPREQVLENFRAFRSRMTWTSKKAILPFLFCCFLYPVGVLLRLSRLASVRNAPRRPRECYKDLAVPVFKFLAARECYKDPEVPLVKFLAARECYKFPRECYKDPEVPLVKF